MGHSYFSNHARIVGLALVGAGALAACGDNITGAQTVNLDFNPDEAVFDAVVPGRFSTASVVLSNEGEAEARFETVSITGAGADQVTWEITGPDGFFASGDGSTADLSELKLANEESALISLTFTPTSEAALNAEMNFLGVNFPDADGVLSLTSAAAAPQLLVNPNPINFGRVDVDQTKITTVTLQNIGSAQMTIDSLSILQAASFFEVTDETQALFPITLGALGSGTESMDIDLTFYSPSVDPRQAKLRVHTDDTPASAINGGYEEFTMLANGAEPCISVNYEDGYSFGQSVTGQVHQAVFIVENCSSINNGEPLVVSSIAWVEGSDNPEFGLPEENLPGPGGMVTIAPEESETFVVTYNPEVVDGIVDTRMLEIISDDPQKGILEIEIQGLASDNQAPEALCSCRVAPSGAPNVLVNAEPLDTLNCSSAGSSDPDGSVVGYLWEVSGPSSSGSVMSPDNAADSNFFIDVAGEYAISLTVFDDDGAASVPCDVDVSAVPGEDLHIQLSWDTPGDSNQTDSLGADVDLHMTHPLASTWNDTRYAVYFANKNPNWSGSQPSLDIDDVDGLGPENINYDDGAAGTSYKIGVNYYDDWGMGQSDVLVKVYWLGVPIYTQNRILRNGEFWYVGDFFWPNAGSMATVTEADEVFSSITAANSAL